MKNKDLGRIVLLSATLLTGCAPWRISVKYPFEDEPNYNSDCKNNLPPQIEVIEKNKSILIYDPDNRLEFFGWDFDTKVVYAIDECNNVTYKKLP